MALFADEISRAFVMGLGLHFWMGKWIGSGLGLGFGEDGGLVLLILLILWEGLSVELSFLYG